MTAQIIYGHDFKAKAEKERDALEQFANQVANLAIGETAEITLGELIQSSHFVADEKDLA